MVINLYTAIPTDHGLVGFALALGQNLCRPVQLLPLTQLPAPDVLRRQRLRVEQAELLAAAADAEHDLERLAYGDVPADAGREQGLRHHLDALRSRLRGIEAVLGLGKGGLDNG